MQQSSISHKEALEKLIAGNERYQENTLTHITGIDGDRRKALAAGQAPFATILTCSDSRVAPEHIFDAGLGELFVCRNAGNLVDEVILGSMEFAVTHSGCPLIMVMGHDRCGALGAALKAAKDPEFSKSPNIDDIIRRLLPAVIATREGQSDDLAWTDAAAKKNVEFTCSKILQQSKIIQEKVKLGDMAVIGTWYDLESGRVEVIFPPV